MSKRFSANSRWVLLGYRGSAAMGRDLVATVASGLPWLFEFLGYSSHGGKSPASLLPLLGLLGVALWWFPPSQGAAQLEIVDGQMQLSNPRWHRTVSLTRWRAALDPERGEVHPEPLLCRAGRSLPDWRVALGSLRAPTDDYRHQSLDDPSLHALLDNPAADPEQRLGAALALGASASERARIGEVARSCLEPGLRVALEHIARDDVSDETLERALAEAADQRSSTR